MARLHARKLTHTRACHVPPSPHPCPGLGLFVDSGAVGPGAVVALFPGLVYGRDQYRRMPGYPKVDRGNPYLLARYDARILDSQPWGRGRLPPPLPGSEGGEGGGDTGGGADATHASPQPPRRRNLLQRIAVASDGPAVPVMESVTWVTPTTGEAAALELLEGRHPLALAHYANHPGEDSAPNTMLAPFTWRLPLARRADRDGRDNDDGDSSDDEEAAGDEQQERQSAQPPGVAGAGPWVRAYLPTLGYGRELSAEVLREEVHGVALIALQPLGAGEEVVFNYRLSPGLGRPAWYVPVDEVEEDRRWA